MFNIGKRLDDIFELTSAENLLIFGTSKRKATRFVEKTDDEPDENAEQLRMFQLPTSKLQDCAIKTVLNEAIEQAELFLIKFPKHVKPPKYVFQNTISAFLNRRGTNQLEFDSYYRWNDADLVIAKLHVEYIIFTKNISHLLETLRNSRSFRKFNMTINEMLELEKYVGNLEQENLDNIKFLRQQELHLVKLCRSKQTSKEFKALDKEYHHIENDYHDNQIIRAAQLRLNKNVFSSQINQVRIAEQKISDELLDARVGLKRNCNIEGIVFEQSSRCNALMIEDYKRQIEEVSLKYETDLAKAELDITRMQSELNYFEENWERKRADLIYMKNECEDYIESIRQRTREVIAKRLAQIWIASARKTIAERKRKAKRLAKKNKEKERIMKRSEIKKK